MDLDFYSRLLLLIIVWLIFFTIVYAILVSPTDFDARALAILIPVSTFLWCLYLWYWFKPSVKGFSCSFEIPLIPDSGLSISFGVDGISLCFLLLTTFLMPLCTYAALGTAETPEKCKQFVVYILFLEIFLVLSFTVTNILSFYVFFESVLVPMFLMIGGWGSRSRKIKAAFYLFIYTLAGSFFLLYGIYQVHIIVGSLDYRIILSHPFTLDQQISLLFFFFVPFAIKIPMFPFHLWLPEAHVEAPTIASVILASLLLKLGGYAFIRFTITMLPQGCLYYFQVLSVIAIMSFVFGSFLSLCQNDLKRVIAYSSIAHMNLAVLGLFSYTHQGLDGAIYLMMAHGITSSGLFFCIGILYERYHTRLVQHYSGLAQVMPVFCTFFFLFTLGNLGFPGTGNFVSEVLLNAGVLDNNTFLVVFLGIALVLSAVYSLWLFNRVAFGTLKEGNDNIRVYADINRRELYILLILVTAMVLLGISSASVTDLIAEPVKQILVNAGINR